MSQKPSPRESKGGTTPGRLPKAGIAARHSSAEALVVEFRITQGMEKQLQTDLVTALDRFRAQHKLAKSDVQSREESRKEGLSGELIIAFWIAVAAGVAVEVGKVILKDVIIPLLKKYRGKILKMN